MPANSFATNPVLLAGMKGYVGPRAATPGAPGAIGGVPGSANPATSGSPAYFAGDPSVTPPTSPTSTSGASIINNAIPGAPGLTNSASTNTANLLNGLPSTSATRKANAVYGVNSGLAPGSDFLKTRMFDTYGQNVDARNQEGLQNYLALISGVTGPELAQNAQNNQASQFGQSLAEQRSEFANRLKQQQDEFNQSNDLALQEFGFNRARYFTGLQKQNGKQFPYVSNQIPGSGQANQTIQQQNDSTPDWWN